MAKRIGDALIERDLLTAAQLEQAIKAQLIFGGHLGTCLIELSFVDEKQLGETLGELFGVDYAPFDLLQDVPQSVVEAVPPAVAEKHQVVPVRLDGKTLHVAMIDPKNLSALDELSFATGYRLAPMIAPEIRIVQAMEKYYGVARRSRYITICRELDEKIDKVHKSLSDGNVPAEQPTESPSVEELLAETEPSAPYDDLYGYGRNWQQVLEETADEVERTAEEAADVLDEAAPGADLDSAAEALTRACDKDDVSRVALDFLTRGRGRALLFSVNSTTASLWAASCVDDRNPTIRDLKFPILSGSMFELLLGNDHFRGGLPEDPQFRWVFGALKIDPPRELVMLPVYLNDRLVAIVYADGGPEGSLEGEDADFVRFARKLALALNLVLLKGKILSA
jgi:hypothetical protein